MTTECILAHCTQVEHNFSFFWLYVVHTSSVIIYVYRVIMSVSFYGPSCPHSFTEESF